MQTATLWWGTEARNPPAAPPACPPAGGCPHYSRPRQSREINVLAASTFLCFFTVVNLMDMGYIPHSVLHEVEERIGNRGLLKSPQASRGGLLANQSHGPTTSCRRCVVCQMPHSHSVGPWFGIRCMVVWYAAVSIGGSGGVRAFGIDKAARSQQEVQEQQAASERHNTSSSEPTSRTGALIDRIPCRPTAQRNSNASRATPADIYRRQRATAGHAPRHARHVTWPVCPQHTHLAVEYALCRLCVSPSFTLVLHSGSVSLSWPRAHALSLVRWCVACGTPHHQWNPLTFTLPFDVAYAPCPARCSPPSPQCRWFSHF